MKKKIRDIKTLVKNGLDYDQMYDTEGTVEYEAHTILEPEVINEFMETYASKIDTTNTQQVEKAEMVFDRYTYTKKEKDTTNKNLEFMLEKKDEIELKKMKIQAK